MTKQKESNSKKTQKGNGILKIFDVFESSEPQAPTGACLNLKLVIHETPESVLYEYSSFMWKPDKNGEVAGKEPKNLNEFLNMSFGLYDPESPRSSTMTERDAVNSLETMGYWAFACINSGEIHIWTDGECEHFHILQLLAHEMGHFVHDFYIDKSSLKDLLLPVTVEQKDIPRDMPREEFVADLFGWVARQSLTWTNCLVEESKGIGDSDG